MKRRRRSKAWLHFTRQDEISAVCNQCSAVISCKGAVTSNMLKHLSTQHGIKYQECHALHRLHTSAYVAAGQTSSTGTPIDNGNVDIKVKKRSVEPQFSMFRC